MKKFERALRSTEGCRKKAKKVRIADDMMQFSLLLHNDSTLFSLQGFCAEGSFEFLHAEGRTHLHMELGGRVDSLIIFLDKANWHSKNCVLSEQRMT
ncbi:hypothetical protein CDAR_382551 [Caerostris darwini]|uniref:Uncharacterized protein n=1 Tax=Caerostris darwini TaxID=1538125 RepID=A0AAV4SNF8_9ARAC|nr:hypothetical protein CDAR_382551 [Caerostris darwini]